MAARSETLLAFDFGERFLGVAVGDTEVGMAHPLVAIDARAAAQRFKAVAALINEWKPTRLVVGLPLSLEGEAHDLTRKAQRFARQLQGRFGLPVSLQDERLSSVEAESRLRAIGRGGRRHKDLTHPVAAQVILQAYLDEAAR
ncbi:MAG: Holliday junction resolvase RuvX [Betaproteobacteria bacterium]|jgi:putative Holliday junction resolvase|nr:Holliday junction resolvase RuvX [Betaproteobacteria bacterium]